MPRTKASCQKTYKNDTKRKGVCRTKNQKEGDKTKRKRPVKPKRKNSLYGNQTATQYWCDPSRKNVMTIGKGSKYGSRSKCDWLTTRYGKKVIP